MSEYHEELHLKFRRGFAEARFPAHLKLQVARLLRPERKTCFLFFLTTSAVWMDLVTQSIFDASRRHQVLDRLGENSFPIVQPLVRRGYTPCCESASIDFQSLRSQTTDQQPSMRKDMEAACWSHDGTRLGMASVHATIGCASTEYKMILCTAWKRFHLSSYRCKSSNDANSSPMFRDQVVQENVAQLAGTTSETLLNTIQRRIRHTCIWER